MYKVVSEEHKCLVMLSIGQSQTVRETKSIFGKAKQQGDKKAILSVMVSQEKGIWGRHPQKFPVFVDIPTPHFQEW